MDTFHLVCVLCFLPSCLPFFLGPAAVGAGLGAVFASRGERVGVELARSRLHRRTAKRTYSYSSDNNNRKNRGSCSNALYTNRRVFRGRPRIKTR